MARARGEIALKAKLLLCRSCRTFDGRMSIITVCIVVEMNAGRGEESLPLTTYKEGDIALYSYKGALAEMFTYTYKCNKKGRMHI